MNLESLNLYVNDIESSIEFYRILGFNFEYRNKSQTYAKLEFENINLCLYTIDSVKEFYTQNTFNKEKTSTFNLSFRMETSEEIDQICINLKKVKIFPIQGPLNTDWGQYVVFFMDPDGNIIEFTSHDTKK